MTMTQKIKNLKYGLKRAKLMIADPDCTEGVQNRAKICAASILMHKRAHPTSSDLYLEEQARKQRERREQWKQRIVNTITLTAVVLGSAIIGVTLGLVLSY